MFNQLLDAATRHDKVAKDTAANQQCKVQQAKTNVSCNSKDKGANKTKTTNGDGCWEYYSPGDWIKLPFKKRKLFLSNAKRRPNLPASLV
jgi:hypothetical protein